MQHFENFLMALEATMHNPVTFVINESLFGKLRFDCWNQPSGERIYLSCPLVRIGTVRFLETNSPHYRSGAEIKKPNWEL